MPGDTFTWSDTAYDRYGFSAIAPGATVRSKSAVYRLTYRPDTPITLAAGDYYFSHDAEVVPLPSVLLVGGPMLGLIAAMRKRRAKHATA